MTTVSELFVPQYGHSLELNSLELSSGSGSVNFVGRAARRNGVTATVKAIDGLEPAPAGSITVALGGQGGAGVAFLQPFPFYCGRDVMILTPKDPMSDQEKLWWVSCITANRFRFGFGRQANKSLAALSLPSKNKTPKWVSAVNLDQFKGADAAISDSTPQALSPGAWSNFRYDEIFNIKNGYYNKKPPECEPGSDALPFIGATDSNNGVTSYRHLEDISSYARNGELEYDASVEKKVFPPNGITVSNNGSIGFAFFQPQSFTCSHDINPLYLLAEEMFPEIGLFLCTIIAMDRYRWGYGRKWRPIRMPNSIIKLPVCSDGQPDWKFMEGYVRALPYSKSI
jgi:type I restriction modification DNA specificity protein